MTPPTITDWIQAIGILLTFPTAAWGIVKLFRRDKERDEQICSLKSMAEQMVNQVIELQKHTMHLSDANEILREQIKLQAEALLNDKNYKDSMLKLEKTKQLHALKPNFTLHCSSTGGVKYDAVITNIGKRAHNPRLEDVKLEKMKHLGVSQDKTVESNAKIKLEGALVEKNDNTCLPAKATAKLICEDDDGNTYEQLITINNKKTVIEPPHLIIHQYA